MSYSRADVLFADQLVVALEDRGFDPILDRHDIDPGEAWKTRLGGLILSTDAVAFVLTDKSAGSPICAWEVEEAKRLGKRIVPIVPGPVTATPPQALADLNWIHCYSTEANPGSGIYDGLRKLERALKVDLGWLRDQTRLSERAEEWRRTQAEDRLLRGQVMRDALDWLGRKPADASVTPLVRDYITASADAEQGREAAARAQLEEKEKALQTAQAAVKQVADAQAAEAKQRRSLRVLTVASLVIGVMLTAGAACGLWYAGKMTAEAGQRRAVLFAQASGELVRERDRTLASMMAVAGESESWFESLNNPSGYPELDAAIIRASSDERLISKVDLKTSLGVDRAELTALAPVPGTSRFITFWNEWKNDGEDSSELVGQHVSVWETGASKPVSTQVLKSGVEGYTDDDVRNVEQAIVLPDRDTVLTYWEGRPATLWSLSQNRIIKVLDGGAEASASTAIAADPKGAYVLVAEDNGDVRQWRLDILDAAPVTFEGVGSSLSMLAIGPDGRSFYGADSSGRVVSWTLDEPRKPGISDEAEIFETASALVPLPAGPRVVTSGGLIRYPPKIATSSYFDLLEGFPGLGQGSDGRPIEVRTVLVSPNHERVLVLPDRDSGGEPKLYRIYDGGVEIGLFDKGTRADKAAFVEGAEAVITATNDAISAWRYANAFLTDNLTDTTGAEPRYLSHIVFGGHAALLASRDGDRILRWSQKPEKQAWANRLGDLNGSPIQYFDGKLAAGLSQDDRYGVWRVGEEKPLNLIERKDLCAGNYLLTAVDLVFSPDGKGFLTSCADRMVKAWRVGEDKAIGKITVPGDKTLNLMAYAPDGVHIAVVPSDEFQLWTLGAETPTQKLKLEGLQGKYAFSPDLAYLAAYTASDEFVLYRLSDGFPVVHSTDGHGAPERVEFSADGKSVVARTADGFGFVWIVGQRNPIQVFDTPGLNESYVHIEPDGRRLLTGSLQTLARIDVDPLGQATRSQRLKSICEHATARGFTGFSAVDRRRFPILDGMPDNPCLARGILKTSTAALGANEPLQAAISKNQSPN